MKEVDILQSATKAEIAKINAQAEREASVLINEANSQVCQSSTLDGRDFDCERLNTKVKSADISTVVDTTLTRCRRDRVRPCAWSKPRRQSGTRGSSSSSTGRMQTFSSTSKSNRSTGKLEIRWSLVSMALACSTLGLGYCSL
eukprot:732203-Pleurochrysis_carterae.AAC.4